MRLSIIIPSFNEAVNFKRGCLNQIVDYLRVHELPWQVILVDDGSTDGSNRLLARYCRQHHWLFIQNSHQGKVAAVKAGVLAAINPYILFTDFDQATPITEVAKLLPYIDKKFDIIIGSREIKGASRRKEPFYRHLMGKVFNYLVQFIALRGIYDTQCGFKIFKTSVAKNLFQSLKVYQPKTETYAFTGAFDVELLYLAKKKRLKIIEVPINWTHAATTRVNPIRDSLRMFWDVLKIKLIDLAGGYREI